MNLKLLHSESIYIIFLSYFLSSNPYALLPQLSLFMDGQRAVNSASRSQFDLAFFFFFLCETFYYSQHFFNSYCLNCLLCFFRREAKYSVSVRITGVKENQCCLSLQNVFKAYKYLCSAFLCFQIFILKIIYLNEREREKD